MTESGRYHGGLVFFGDADSALTKFNGIVSTTLEEHGHRVERQSRLSYGDARTASSQYLVQVSVSRTGAPGDQAQRRLRLDKAVGLRPGRKVDPDRRPYRAEITLVHVDPARDDRELSELLMVLMLYRMAHACEASHVEWLSPDTVLTMDDFASAFGPPTTGPSAALDCVASETDGAPIILFSNALVEEVQSAAAEDALIHKSEEDRLALAFRSEVTDEEIKIVEAEQSRLERVAIWSMTGAVATLSVPVAASMAAVNVIRGEDFRLNAQVLAVTAAVVVLQSSGALAKALSQLPL